VWGIGYRADEAERYREFWGENLPGKCLMKMRERLRTEGDGEKCGEVEEDIEATEGEGVGDEVVNGEIVK